MKFTLLMLLAVLLAASAQAQTPPQAAHADTAAPAHALAFDPARDAAADIRLAVADAQRSNKRVLLDVGGNWCKWCKMLDKFFENDTATSRYLHDHFVVVKVNFSKENDNKALLSAYPKIPGYPHFFILESDGALLHSQDTGVLEKGQGHDAKKIMVFLKKWTK